MFQYEKAISESHGDLNATVYLATGSDESRRMVVNARNFGQILIERSYPNINIRSVILEEENHRSIFPIAFTKGIRYIFSQRSGIISSPSPI